MKDNTAQSGKEQNQAFAKTAPETPVTPATPTRKAARGVTAESAPVLTRGQKYSSPEGRHSQQTHRRAEERGAAAGHTTEKEQHAQDRSDVVAEIDRVAEAKVKQKEQHARGSAPKA